MIYATPENMWPMNINTAWIVGNAWRVIYYSPDPRIEQNSLTIAVRGGIVFG